MSEQVDPAPTDDEDDDLAPRRSGPRLGQRLSGMVPVIGCAMCCFLLAKYKTDALYVLQSGTPLDMGEPGAYHMQEAFNGAFVKIRGEVRGDGARFQSTNGVFGKVWPISGAPVIIQRNDFHDLADKKDIRGPHGDVTAQGMLQMDDQLGPEYKPVMAAFLRRHELGVPGPDVQTAHVWVLRSGHTPRSLDGTNAWVVMVALLLFFNMWWLVKPFLRRG